MAAVSRVGTAEPADYSQSMWPSSNFPFDSLNSVDFP